MKKLLLTIAVIVALGSAGGIYVYQQKQKPVAQKQVQTLSVYQTVQIDSAGKRTRLQTSPGTTALDLLKKNALVTMKGSGASAFVTAVNGRTASEASKEFWSFYLNGNQAQVGAGSYILKPNDDIVWKIETY